MTSEAREALREKVARALYESCQNDVPILRGPPWDEVRDDARRNILRDADAAIDMVLEEAARVADASALEAWDFGADETRGLMRLQAADIAAAIRAMKGKD
jgi:hypothetical protein